MVLKGPFKVRRDPDIKQGLGAMGVRDYAEAMTYTYMTFLYDWKSEMSIDLRIGDQN